MTATRSRDTPARPDPAAIDGHTGARLGSSPPLARRLRSTDLLGSDQQVEIQHGEAVYRLRRTSLGKLILTK